jgi:photosystem II stability/assembly factor-like uncharacterized protein
MRQKHETTFAAAAAFLFACACAAPPPGRVAPKWTAQESGTRASLRGICAVDRNVAWASGSDGTVLRTTDGGASWRAIAVRGAESADFRDVHATDASTAWILTAGTPARILSTTDGGQTWTEQYRDDRAEAFLDGFAFWDGGAAVAFGDPVAGAFEILRADDGARWDRVPPRDFPPAIPGEAGFAASGTCVATGHGGRAWICTGGTAARVLRSDDFGRTWWAVPTPLRCGSASTGGFSLAFADRDHGVLVGGDYTAPSDATRNAAITEDGGATWQPIDAAGPRGYRSCVAWTHGPSGPLWIAVGSSGCDVSADGGRTWQALEAPGYHAISFTRTGDTGWAVGADGRIARVDR